MKSALYAFLLFVALALGFWCGTRFQAGVEELRVRTQVMSGPYRDNFDPALTAIKAARAKLHQGDTNIMAELDESQSQIEKAKAWSQSFASGELRGAANQSQPVRSGTNSTPAAAGSGR